MSMVLTIWNPRKDCTKKLGQKANNWYPSIWMCQEKYLHSSEAGNSMEDSETNCRSGKCRCSCAHALHQHSLFSITTIIGINGLSSTGHMMEEGVLNPGFPSQKWMDHNCDRFLIRFFFSDLDAIVRNEPIWRNSGSYFDGFTFGHCRGLDFMCFLKSCCLTQTYDSLFSFGIRIFWAPRSFVRKTELGRLISRIHHSAMLHFSRSKYTEMPSIKNISPNRCP
jgi:hypothetical protein